MYFSYMEFFKEYFSYIWSSSKSIFHVKMIMVNLVIDGTFETALP